MKHSASSENMRGSELVTKLRSELELIRDEMYAMEASKSVSLSDIAPHFRSSATNLLHYLALRRHDIRSLQIKLTSLGLSSIPSLSHGTRIKMPDFSVLTHYFIDKTKCYSAGIIRRKGDLLRDLHLLKTISVVK